MKKFLLPFLTGAMPLASFAFDVNLASAGSLASMAPNLNTETAVKISGKMNAADFSYLLDNCSALESLDLSEATIVAYAGNSLPYTSMSHSAANRLPDYSLTGIKSLRTVILPSSLTAIGKGSLSGTAIESLDIPTTVTEIAPYAFLRCNSLSKITIPASVQNIGQRAFAYCKSLNEIIFSNNSQLRAIPEGMVEACGGLQAINTERLTACTEIGPWGLAQCNGLVTLVLPENLTTIGAQCLAETSQVKVLTLPSSLVQINTEAMAGMTGLVDVHAEALTQVPNLGENVWRNVEQGKVKLVAPNNLTNEFKAAAQWQDFNVMSQNDFETSTKNVAADLANPSGIKAYVDGSSLIVKAETALGSYAVFNAAGSRIMAGSTSAESISLSVDGVPHGVYLIVTSQGVAKISL